MKKLGVVMFLVGSALACGGKTTTEPSPTVSLALSAASLTVERNGTGQISASFGPASAMADVTDQAEWTSSNPAVVTVKRGLVTAVGIGSSVVTALYEGRTQTSVVTARRRTMISGQITITQAQSLETLIVLRAFVDGRFMGGRSTSAARSSMTVVFSNSPAVDRHVVPGQVEIAIDAPEQMHAPNAYVSDTTSQVVVIDQDTGEQLAVIPLPAKQFTLDVTGTTSWVVTIPSFSS